MIATTSHDMRTPLNTKINTIKVVQEKIKNEQINKWLEITMNSCNLLMFLVNDTLDFFQIKSCKFSLKKKKFTLQKLIKNSFDLVRI